jgi:hypothetical protein
VPVLMISAIAARKCLRSRIRFGCDVVGNSTCMVGLVVGLLVIWLILAVLGLVIKGLFWLFVVAAVLFVATAIVGWVRRRV